MLLFLLLCLVTTTTCYQMYRPCVSPSRWQGTMILTNGTTGENEFYQIYVDGKRGRMRLNGIGYHLIHTLLDSFAVDEVNSLCRRYATTNQHPWIVGVPFGIPTKTSFVAEGYFGALENNDNVITWHGQLGKYKISGSWTRKGCYPTVFNTFHTETGQFISRRFYDISAEVFPDDYLTAPDICFD